MFYKILAVLIGFVFSVIVWASLSPIEDIRCCFVPPRDTSGTIIRSATVRAIFKKLYPCPSTHLTYGACPKWILDHPIPLACGGVDAVYNLQWLPEDQWKLKSTWERKVYGGHNMSPGCP